MNTPTDTLSTAQATPAAEGTALYYALLYADQVTSQRAVDTLSFIQAISSTLNDVSEPQVAEKKIHWWHEELARLSKQSARHPACIAVQDFLHTQEAVEASLNVLSAAATERYNPIPTEQELQMHISVDYGSRLMLFDNALSKTMSSIRSTGMSNGAKPIKLQKKSSLLGNNDVGVSTKQDAIALGLGQFDRLNSLVKRLRSGYLVFSEEQYTKHNITADDLLNRSAHESTTEPTIQTNIDELLANSITNTNSALEHALTCIADTRTSDATSLPIQILCHIRAAQVKLWKKRNPDILNESLALTPLRKFIIAYRCKRRFSNT